MAGEIILSEVTTPSTPGSNKESLFISNDATPRVKRVNSAGTIITSLENNVAMPAGTASVAPFQLTSGTSLTSAAAGAVEFDGTAFYSTPVAGARGVSPSTMYAIVASGGFALQTAAGVQSAFATTNDVWTLAATTTYLFEGLYWIQKTTNSVTVAMAFAAAGGLTVTSILYSVWGANIAADTTTATTAYTVVDTIATTVVNATSSSNSALTFRGLLRTNVAGTLTPQVNFSGTAAGTPTMLANSYIMFTPLGTNTNNQIGNVG